MALNAAGVEFREEPRVTRPHRKLPRRWHAHGTHTARSRHGWWHGRGTLEVVAWWPPYLNPSGIGEFDESFGTHVLWSVRAQLTHAESTRRNREPQGHPGRRAGTSRTGVAGWRAYPELIHRLAVSTNRHRDRREPPARAACGRHPARAVASQFEPAIRHWADVGVALMCNDVTLSRSEGL